MRNAIPAFIALTVVQIAWGYSPANGQTRIELASTIDHVQPMTGIVLWSDHGQVDTDAIALEFRYCGYDEIVRPNGEYDYCFLEKILDEIAARGHQAVLRFRFVYPGKKSTVPEFIRTSADYHETIAKSEGKKTTFCDWSNRELQQFTLDFYKRFAHRYDKDPRIAFLQTGFGLWAEYHIYDGPAVVGETFPDKAFQAQFLAQMDRVFDNLPWSISVDAADSDYTPIEDNSSLLDLSFGVFDDSFMCEQHSRVNSLNWETLGADRWKSSPAGGEFSYYNQRDQKLALSKKGPHGISFEAAAKQFHITYMIGSDQPGFQSMQRIKQAGMATGYRFRVIEISADKDTVRVRVTNEGVAPIYRDAYFAAGSQRSPDSLRGLLPGQNKVYEISPVSEQDRHRISIQSDQILPTQTIQFLGTSE